MIIIIIIIGGGGAKVMVVVVVVVVMLVTNHAYIHKFTALSTPAFSIPATHSSML
jgi:hypothetical protein